MSEVESEIINKEKLKQKAQIIKKLDQLPFGRWHLFMIFSLGLIWIFDGYQVSLISLLRKPIVQQFNQYSFKSLAISYQVGCILGALVFGISAYIIGRKKIFLITIIIYFFGILISLIPNSIQLFIFARFLIGISVGGQFTSIFTAVDEFLPPKYRGRVNIGIDGTWHLGASFAAIINIIIGQTEFWRYFFTLGIIGIFSLFFMRKNIPESPRWLLLKQKKQQAKLIIRKIEYAITRNKYTLELSKYDQNKKSYKLQTQLDSQRSQMTYQISQLNIDQSSQNKKSLILNLVEIIMTIWKTFLNFKNRFLLAFILMFSQSFFFNLIYYKFPAILQNRFHLNQNQISFYMLPLSLSSFISTLFIGPLFDKIGRKKLLLTTYMTSGILLIVSDLMESLNWFQIIICFLFVFTSPAGSSANLIASQIFPTNSRTLILFIMFIVGISGGIFGVWFDTVWIGSILMMISGIIGYVFCPSAQNKSLEEIQKI